MVHDVQARRQDRLVATLMLTCSQWRGWQWWWLLLLLHLGGQWLWWLRGWQLLVLLEMTELYLLVVTKLDLDRRGLQGTLSVLGMCWWCPSTGGVWALLQGLCVGELAQSLGGTLWLSVQLGIQPGLHQLHRSGATGLLFLTGRCCSCVLGRHMWWGLHLGRLSEALRMVYARVQGLAFVHMEGRGAVRTANWCGT